MSARRAVRAVGAEDVKAALDYWRVSFSGLPGLVEQLEQANRQREAGEDYYRTRSAGSAVSGEVRARGKHVDWAHSFEKVLLDVLPMSGAVNRNWLSAQFPDRTIHAFEAALSRLRAKGLIRMSGKCSLRIIERCK